MRTSFPCFFSVSRRPRPARWLQGAVLAVVGLGAALPGLAAPSNLALEDISRGVVQVLTSSGSGSGSVMELDGRPVVLTNRHVVLGHDSARIAVLEDPHEPAQMAYTGELIGFSTDYDVALLRIVADRDGNPVDGMGDVSVPALDFAEQTTAMQRGDPLALLGYPGLGGNELIYTPGTVSAISYGDHAGRRLPLWYRTNAEMSAGSSGGVALNEQGEVIGMPTQVETELQTGGRLGSLLAMDVVHALIADEAWTTDWAEFSPLRPGVAPTYGEVSLAPGFEPLIHEVDVMAGGLAELDPVGAGCTGFASVAPDYRLDWRGEGEDLFVYFQAQYSDHDAVMAVQTPAGDWLCNDDVSGGTWDPGLTIEQAPAGIYSIWIGAYYDGSYFDGRLSVTASRAAFDEFALSEVDDGDGAALLDWTRAPYFGTETLSARSARGAPEFHITAGGEAHLPEQEPLDADCTGYVAVAPDLRVHWSGTTDALALDFRPHSGTPAMTLVIRGPNGDWQCRAASDGRPRVSLEQPESGQYDIWVGTASSNHFIDGSLRVRESAVTAAE